MLQISSRKQTPSTEILLAYTLDVLTPLLGFGGCARPLHEAGYVRIVDLVMADPDAIRAVPGIGPSRFRLLHRALLGLGLGDYLWSAVARRNEGTAQPEGFTDGEVRFH